MPAAIVREPGYKNAPYELPPDLQALFDETAEKLVLPKTKVLALALAKGLPLIRQFLLDEEAPSDSHQDDATRLHAASRELSRFDAAPVGPERKAILNSIPGLLPTPLAERARLIIAGPGRAAERKAQLADLLAAEFVASQSLNAASITSEGEEHP